MINFLNFSLYLQNHISFLKLIFYRPNNGNNGTITGLKVFLSKNKKKKTLLLFGLITSENEEDV